VIDVSVLVGCQVREQTTGRTGRLASVSLPWVKVAWNEHPLRRAVEETYARSDQRIWTDFEMFTLNGGWVSMGSLLGARPRGRIKQFTEELGRLLEDDSLTERVEIPNAEEQKQAWAALTKQLKTVGLPTSKNKYRTKVDPDEFMLMSMNNRYYMFKHRLTRNYLGVDRRTGKVVTFSDNKPFFRGFYDERLEDVQVEILYRKERKGGFRRHVFDSQAEASEFASQLLSEEFAEVRWRTGDMVEDWEIELTGLFEALAEGCRSCEGAKLESITGTNLFDRKTDGVKSDPDDWDCSEDGACVHGPSGFVIQIDVGE